MRIEKPIIFRYRDYRSFLKDYYDWNKRNDPSFSIRYFAQKAGLKSYNYLSLVMNGKRRLTPQFINPFSSALKLNPQEQHYLEALVKAEHAPEKSEATLASLRPAAKVSRLRSKTRLQLLKEWHYYPILEATDLPDFDGTPAWIAKRLGLQVRKTKAALKELQDAGYLELKGGILRKTHRSSHQGDEASDFMIRRYHAKNLGVAAERSLSIAPERKQFTALTFTADSGKLQKIRELARAYIEELYRILDEPNSDDPADNDLYQMGTQLYPLSTKR